MSVPSSGQTAADDSRRTAARVWFGLTAFAVAAGLVIQVPVSAANTEGFFADPLARGLNTFAFFTVQSNIIVGVTSLLLWLRLDRGSAVFAVFRLIGVVAITVTGVVYHTLLRGLFDLTAWGTVADMLLHTVVPLLGLGGWLLLGPRRLTSWRVVGLTVLFPLMWGLFTLVRGPLVGRFYPYPFVDVGELGYARVLLNCLGIGLGFLALAGALHLLDPRLPGVRAADAEGITRAA